MWEHASTITTIASFVLTAIGTLISVTWKLSRVEIALRQDITKARDEIEDRQDRITREFGETVAALRQHVHNIETWARDEFVRKEGFYKVRDDMSADLQRLGDKIEARLERMEAKIDSKT